MSASQPPALRPLGTVPTPLHRLEGLMREFPGGPELLIKREDLCRPAARGCKARKLVALMADAQSIPTTFILTTGSAQSNYCAMTAVAAAMYGMRTELHLAGRDPGPRTGNLCIAGLAGATVRFTGARPGSNAGPAMQARATEFRAAGEVPYVISLGGSTRAGQRPGRLAAHSDAILLDSTCTAKAMAGLLQGIADDTYRRGDRGVFHTPAGSAACSPEPAPQTCATRH